MSYNPYLRAKPDEDRCSAIRPADAYRDVGPRCEYRPHRYGIHAASTGAIQWTEWCPERDCERVAGHSGCHHAGCYDEHGHTDGCEYGGDE